MRLSSILLRHAALASVVLMGLGLLGAWTFPSMAVSPDGRLAYLRLAGPTKGTEPWAGACYVYVQVIDGPSSPPLETLCGQNRLFLEERLSWEGTSWRLSVTTSSGKQWLYDFQGDTLDRSRPHPRLVPPARPLSEETRRRLDRLPAALRERPPLREVRIPEPRGPDSRVPRTALGHYAEDEWVNDDPETLVVIEGRAHAPYVISRGPVLLAGQATANRVKTQAWVLVDDWAHLAIFPSAAKVFVSESVLPRWNYIKPAVTVVSSSFRGSSEPGTPPRER